MTRIIGRTGSRRRSWSLFLAILSTVAMLALVVVPAQAALDRDLFELDKDAFDDVTSTRLGTLGSQVANTTTTSVNVCRTADEPTTPFTILIDAERMRVTAAVDGSFGGNCAGGTKRTYTVIRGFNSTLTSGHASGENVTLLNLDVNGDPIGTVSGTDWDKIYAEVVLDPDTKCTDITNVVECQWVHDGRATSIFTQSKDYDEISDEGGATSVWKWRNQSVPDADELDDGFAAKIDDGGEQSLFFGADRFATNGSKDAGFWFFHDAVGTVGDGSTDGTFTGLHTAPSPGDNGIFCNQAGNTTNPNCSPRDDDDVSGDILILTTFTNGGAVTTVRVFEWIGPAGSTAALASRGTASDCVPGDGTQLLCATVNNTTIESPWIYSGKGEPQPDEISAGGFLEGGINLSDLGLEGCFSSFMATTRSSPSLTADPKDFILGDFQACGAALTTKPANGSGVDLTDTDDPENDLVDTQLGTGDAGVDVTDNALLEVSGTTDFTGTISYFICGPITTGTCDSGGVAAGTDNVTANGTYTSDVVNLTEVGRYCWRGEFTSTTPGLEAGATDASEGECFEVKPVTPTLTTTAVDSEGNALTGPVDFGSAVYDKANLTGTAFQPGTDGDDTTYPSINATMDTAANGTITFTLVGPDGNTTDCTTENAGTAGTNPEDVTVSGDGDYFTTGFTPDAPGDYHWKASYDGSSPNTLGTSHNDDCDETGEDVTVQQIPTQIKTQQSWFPNDTATITSTVTGDALEADGTVVFSLYDNAECTGDALYTETVTLTGGEESEEVGTDNQTFEVTTGYDDAADSVAGPYSWLVVYTPAAGDTAHTGIQSACDAEHFSITYTNDPGPGTDLA